MNKPAFLITIDVEGDDCWARSRTVTTRNAEALPRFQSLCESFGMKPTYLTNHEMVRSPAFRELARDVLRRGTAEIGMHLHAWSSPPDVPLSEEDFRSHPYLPEFPEPVMRAKITVLTDLLEQTFAVKMRSHRAGRWGFDERYAKILIEHGYLADCSVTPNVSWAAEPGNPRGPGGPDYSGAPEHPYFLDPNDIRRPGDSSLLEVPVTIRRRARWLAALVPSRSVAGRALDRLSPRWLRPNGKNRRALLRLVDRAIRRRDCHLEFMLHSSELMAGGSPTFRSERSIERLYADLDALFEHTRERTRSLTLGDFAESYPRSGSSAASRPGTPIARTG